jgi:hypothetical protein
MAAGLCFGTPSPLAVLISLFCKNYQYLVCAVDALYCLSQISCCKMGTKQESYLFFVLKDICS